MNGIKSAGISVEVSLSSHARPPGHHIRYPYHHMVLNQHTCLLTRLGAISHVCYLHRTSNNVCYKCTQLTGLLSTVVLDLQACLFKFHPASVHVTVCSTCTRPAAQPSLSQGQQTNLPLRMFDYLAQDEHTCLKPSRFFCNSFTRLAGLLQYPCFNLCS